MKKLLKALKEKARNCGVNNKENRARKGAYVDCIVQLEAAINYTHSCKSDSEQLFDFLEWFNNYCTVDIKPNKEDVELYLSK